MTNKQVQLIAEYITGDPDVFCEDMDSMTMAGNNMGSASGMNPPPKPTANKPLTSTEISQEANKATGMNDGATEVANQMKQQQDADKEAQTQKQRILDPQFKQVDSSLQNIGQGIMQGQEAVDSNSNQFGGLDKELSGLQTVLANLQRTANL